MTDLPRWTSRFGPCQASPITALAHDAQGARLVRLAHEHRWVPLDDAHVWAPWLTIGAYYVVDAGGSTALAPAALFDATYQPWVSDASLPGATAQLPLLAWKAPTAGPVTAFSPKE